MTRKDYELIAGALKRSADWGPGKQQQGVERAAKYLASDLQADNPRFDREKFLKACGID